MGAKASTIMMKPDDESEAWRTIGIAVAIAGLSAMAAKLADWGVETLKRRLDPSPCRCDCARACVAKGDTPHPPGALECTLDADFER